MNCITKILPNFKKFNSYIEDVKNNTDSIMLSGLTDVAKIHFAYSTQFYTERPIVIITYNEIQAKKLIKDLMFFEDEIIYFPKREIFAYDYIAENKDNYYERIKVLNKIQNKEAKIIVTTIEAIQQHMVSKEVLYKNRMKLKVGQTIRYKRTKRKTCTIRI